MPFDGTQPARVPSEDDARDLAVLKAMRVRLASPADWANKPPPLAAYWQPDAPVCLMIALFQVAPNLRAHRVPMQRLRAALPGNWISVPGYNDAPDTTHADILAVIDRAIAELEG